VNKSELTNRHREISEGGHKSQGAAFDIFKKWGFIFFFYFPNPF